MAKLYFRYGAMGSGKSIDLLKVAYNYEERGQNVLIFTSSIDDRYGIGKVSSRIGIEKEARIIKNDTDVLLVTNIVLLNEKIDCVLIDEVQFLTKKQIFQLSDIVDYLNVPVICYGLRSDFKLEPFEASKYLMVLADVIEEIPTICWCGKRANVNARILDGKIVKKGEQVQVGGNESYISLCRKHYKEGKIEK